MIIPFRHRLERSIGLHDVKVCVVVEVAGLVDPGPGDHAISYFHGCALQDALAARASQASYWICPVELLQIPSDQIRDRGVSHIRSLLANQKRRPRRDGPVRQAPPIDGAAQMVEVVCTQERSGAKTPTEPDNIAYRGGARRAA